MERELANKGNIKALRTADCQSVPIKPSHKPNNTVSGLSAAVLLAAIAGPTSALDFDYFDGELRGNLDNTIRYGATWRTEDRREDLASTGNVLLLKAQGITTQENRNDGNNNFDPGLVSSTVTWIPELDFSFRNFGGFVRGYAFYDEVIQQNTTDGGTSEDFNNDRRGNVFPQETKDFAGSRAELLDAYIFGDFNLGDMPLNVRLGRQVVSWGESLFFQDGINQANPADLSALRRPGSEIKDALIPIPMAYLQLGLTDSVTVEMYYKFRWEMSQPDPVGTFLSSSDALFGKGAEGVIVNFQGRDATTLAQLAGYNALVNGITDPIQAQQLYVRRGETVEADDGGQFGVSFRWFAAGLNDTEFGFYYQNVHATKQVAGLTTGSLGPFGPFGFIESSSYNWVFPEDIETYGFSFNTNVGGVSLAGEIAFRPDSPISGESGDNLVAYTSVAASTIGAGTATTASFGPTVSAVLREQGLSEEVGLGQSFVNVLERDSYNASLLAIQIFNSLGPIDSLTLVAEVGTAYVAGVSDNFIIASNDSNPVVFTFIPGFGDVQIPSLSTGSVDDYLDRWSWGYRLVIAPTFNDVFAGVKLTPFLRLNHDVEGNSIAGGNFMEGRKAATLGVNANYLQNFGFGASATWFTGAEPRNQLGDRDHVSAYLSYAF